MDDDITVGIDIGGTKVNMGLVTGSGRILAQQRIQVETRMNAEQFIAKICQDLKLLIKTSGLKLEEVKYFGAGVPGTADIHSGLVEYCPNLGWEDVPAGMYFKTHLGAKVIISQDSRCAAWAEFLLGAGRPYRSILCTTLGTGIGAGIILDGKIFHGAMNTAGEIGHAVFARDGRPCACGNRGCLERYCSGTGIIQRALETFPEKFINLPHKSETVFQLAYAGDAEILALIRSVVEDLSVGIANAVSILSPEAVIVSGGLCEHEELIIKPLADLVYQNGYHSWTRKRQLKIEKAQMGSDAPLIGAAMLHRAL
jgi:glucokinase